MGPIFGQVDFTVEQALKARGAVAHMDADDAIVHLAEAAEPLPPRPDRMRAALGGARFIDAADGLDMGVVTGHQLLTAVADVIFIPLDRFQETL
jgi:hypothetical protein